MKRILDPLPSTNQSTSLKSGSLFLVMVSVRTKQNTPIKDLIHFSSFGWCLGVDHCTTQVYKPFLLTLGLNNLNFNVQFLKI